MYYLYFIKENKCDFYGAGDMTYILELLDDYLRRHKMYGKDSVSFKISSGNIEGYCNEKI